MISKIEQEINQIRLDIYEKTKDMNSAQLSDYYKESTDEIIKKFGLKVLDKANTDIKSYEKGA